MSCEQFAKLLINHVLRQFIVTHRPLAQFNQRRPARVFHHLEVGRIDLRMPACIGGAMQVDDYTSAIEAAGLRVTKLKDNPQYLFISKNAQGAARKYGVKSISLVATRD